MSQKISRNYRILLKICSFLQEYFLDSFPENKSHPMTLNVEFKKKCLKNSYFEFDMSEAGAASITIFDDIGKDNWPGVFFADIF